MKKDKTPLKRLDNVRPTKRAARWYLEHLEIYMSGGGSVNSRHAPEIAMWAAAAQGHPTTGWVMHESPSEKGIYYVSLQNAFGGAECYLSRKDLLRVKQ